MTLALTKRIAGGAMGLMLGTLLALAAPLTYAQTSTTTDPGTPGVPATGAGDSTMALVALAGSALALVAGGTYLARTPRSEA